MSCTTMPACLRVSSAIVPVGGLSCHRFHAQGHTACLDPGHVYYTPEVAVDQYPELAPLRTSWCESWNAWMERYVAQARGMEACRLEVFLWLLADLWNERVVTLSAVPRVHAPHPRRCRGSDQRRRGQPDAASRSSGA